MKEAADLLIRVESLPQAKRARPLKSRALYLIHGVREILFLGSGDAFGSAGRFNGRHEALPCNDSSRVSHPSRS